jgi:hypothetical protein
MLLRIYTRIVRHLSPIYFLQILCYRALVHFNPDVPVPWATLTNSTTHENPVAIINRFIRLTRRFKYIPNPIINAYRTRTSHPYNVAPIQIIPTSSPKSRGCQTKSFDFNFNSVSWYQYQYSPSKPNRWNWTRGRYDYT